MLAGLRVPLASFFFRLRALHPMYILRRLENLKETVSLDTCNKTAGATPRPFCVLGFSNEKGI